MRVYKRERKEKAGTTLKRIWKVFDKYSNAVLVIMTVVTSFVAIASCIVAINSFRVAKSSLYLVNNQVEESRKQSEIMMEQYHATILISSISTIPIISYKLEKRWQQANEVGIYIKNAGRGPAIITKATLVVNGKAYDGNNVDSANEAFCALGITPSQGFNISFSCLGENYVLEPGDFTFYIVMNNEKKDKAKFRQFEKALSQLIIKIKYKSFDGAKFEKEIKYSDFK